MTPRTLKIENFYTYPVSGIILIFGTPWLISEHFISQSRKMKLSFLWYVVYIRFCFDRSWNFLEHENSSKSLLTTPLASLGLSRLRPTASFGWSWLCPLSLLVYSIITTFLNIRSEFDLCGLWGCYFCCCILHSLFLTIFFLFFLYTFASSLTVLLSPPVTPLFLFVKFSVSLWFSPLSLNVLSKWVHFLITVVCAFPLLNSTSFLL